MSDPAAAGAPAPTSRDGGPGSTWPRVLVVSGMYPTEGNPVFGAFVARQHEAFSRLGVPHRVVANRQWRPGPAFGLLKYGSLLVRTVVTALRRDFDVVLGHFLYPSAWFARLAARIGGVPYVVVAHGTDVASVQRAGFLARRSLQATREAGGVIAVSRALAERVRGELGVPEAVPIEVVNMGVDRSVFHPRPQARAAMGWPASERVVLTAGNLIPRKAPDIALAGFATLRGQGAADRLVFAGDGPMRAELTAEAERLGVSDAVDLGGALKPARLAEAMAAADVFVLPSRAEPLGVVLLEAMASGTPVVASRVGGITEIVEDGCGLLVEPDDPAALAGAVTTVLESGKESYREACLAAAACSDLDENARRVAEVLARVAARASKGGV